MAFVISFSTFVGCGTKEAEHPELPNYAENGKQFSFFTYGNLNDGTYTVIDKDNTFAESDASVLKDGVFKGQTVLLITGKK